MKLIFPKKYFLRLKKKVAHWLYMKNEKKLVLFPTNFYVKSDFKGGLWSNILASDASKWSKMDITAPKDPIMAVLP